MFPTIEIEAPANPAALDAAIKAAADYDWIVFTSVNGVEAFWDAVQREERAGQTRQGPKFGTKIAAIGPATARALAERRYGTCEWNYGENPPCNVQRARRFPAGEIDVRLNIQKGRIDSVRLFGDYMGRSDIGELEARLRGLAYDRDALASVLGGLAISEYFGDIGREDVLELLAP